MNTLIAILIALFASIGLALLMSYIKYKTPDPSITLISAVVFFWALAFLTAFGLICYLTNMILIEGFFKFIVTFFL